MQELLKLKTMYDNEIRCFINESVTNSPTMNVVKRFSRVRCMDKYIVEVKSKNDYLDFRNRLIGRLKKANEKLATAKNLNSSTITIPDFFLKYKLCLVEGVDEIRYNEINTYHNNGQCTEKEAMKQIEIHSKKLNKDTQELIKEYCNNRQEYEFCKRRLTGTQIIYSYFEPKQNKRVTKSAPTIFAVVGNDFPVTVLPAAQRKNYYPTKTILLLSEGTTINEIYLRKKKKT